MKLSVKRKRVIIGIVIVLIVAIPLGFIAMSIRGFQRDIAPSVTAVDCYEQLSTGWRERLYGENFCLDRAPRFKNSPDRPLCIPRFATRILVIREHWVDAGYCVAFTVPVTSLPNVVKEITGCELSTLKDGITPNQRNIRLPGMCGTDQRKATPYWEIEAVKNGLHLDIDEGDYFGVDMDTGRIYIRIY